MLQGYVRSQIVDGQVTIQCPSVIEGTERCPEEITEDAILQLLNGDDEMVRKYQRFKGARENLNLRECPKCDHPQTGNPEAPQMTCEECGFIYCFHHSNAHPPEESCEAYEARAISKDTRDLLQKTSKPCPACKVLWGRNRVGQETWLCMPHGRSLISQNQASPEPQCLDPNALYIAHPGTPM